MKSILFKELSFIKNNNERRNIYNYKTDRCR